MGVVASEGRERESPAAAAKAQINMGVPLRVHISEEQRRGRKIANSRKCGGARALTLCVATIRGNIKHAFLLPPP